MLYRDLVQFEPVESIIQLLTASEKDKAREHVRTYVISERMADQVTNLVIPQLQFLSPPRQPRRVRRGQLWHRQVAPHVGARCSGRAR